MKAVLQRVTEASVWVDGKEVSAIDRGWLILLGISSKDSEEQIPYRIKKIMSLRGFCDNEGKMNLSIKDVSGCLLIASQFTLYGNCSKGRRPNFTGAAHPELAEPLYEMFCSKLRDLGVKKVAQGIFGAMMEVSLLNDGPVTLIVETKNS